MTHFRLKLTYILLTSKLNKARGCSYIDDDGNSSGSSSDVQIVQPYDKTFKSPPSIDQSTVTDTTRGPGELEHPDKDTPYEDKSVNKRKRSPLLSENGNEDDRLDETRKNLNGVLNDRLR